MRYVVATCSGYLTEAVGGGPYALSAHVLDTANAHRVVSLFRSEDFARTLPVLRGHKSSVEAALEAAEIEAASLNQVAA